MLTRRAILTGAGGALALGTVGIGWSRYLAENRYSDYASALRRPLANDAGIMEMVRYASLAANGHNTQPWRFRSQADRITVLPDFSRRTPVADPDDHHLYVALGCATENLAIAAAASGRPGDVVIDGNGRQGAALVFLPAAKAAADDFQASLFDAIPKRQSTRSLFDGKPVATSDIDKLEAVSAVAGVDLALLTDRRSIDAVRDLVVAGNDAQMADPAFVRELKQWLRFSPGTAMARGDGLYAAASGNPVLPDWLGSIAFDLVFNAGSENEKYARQMNSSPGVAVFSAAVEGPPGWLAVGRACQRFCLMATALGLKLAFVNQPVEVAALRPQLASLVGFAGRRPDIVLRFGYAPPMPYSPRRPAEGLLLA